jgi:hypothetical protein
VAGPDFVGLAGFVGLPGSPVAAWPHAGGVLGVLRRPFVDDGPGNLAKHTSVDLGHLTVGGRGRRVGALSDDRLAGFG